MGYDGRPFAGFARQVGLLTVEGVLLEALAEAAGLECRDRTEGSELKDQNAAARLLGYRNGSRTDRGVSAACNVISILWPERLGEMGPRGVKAFLNRTSTRMLADGHPIFPGPWAQVEDDFLPRHAVERTYRYLLPAEGLELPPMEQTAKLLEGEHDFATFCRVDGKSTLLTLSACQVRTNGPGYTLGNLSPARDTPRTMESVPARYLTLTFTAPYFRWQMVRRLVAALEAVGRGRSTPERVQEALENPEPSRSWGAATPENLTLERVVYANLEWRSWRPC